MNKNIFYFHGFASSADSTKAKVFDEFIKKKFPNVHLHIPNIDNSIEKSFIQLETLVEENAGDKLFIGSSLGGFYASYFAEKFDSRAVLINPASNPYLGMEMYLGKNTNFSTNEEFYLTKKDLEILLTKRSNSLKNHPGQIAFPGGKKDQIDSSPIETALRETQEEVGLKSKKM